MASTSAASPVAPTEEKAHSPTRANTGLRKTEPYWYEFQTYAKQRWFGRELLEIFTTEFRDRTKEYYIWAIHKGICNVNGKHADARQTIQDGDQITNSVHRHEPPVTDEPIKILHRDDEKGILVIVKPGSIPVHAAGRYLRHTLTELLQSEHGIERLYTVNRLDRLTSGIMVCSTKKETASRIGSLFHAGLVNKAYVCRVRGKFPDGEVVCKEPILSIDRQSGVNIVHPKGKSCETIFVRLSYDAQDDSSVVFCRPITGRTHQIRVHVQWLGHPICNDPIYGHNVWSRVDTSRFSEVVPDQWKGVGGVTGNQEVDQVIQAIKSEKDDQEDWARWKDEVLFKDLNREAGLQDVYVPGPNGKSSKPSDELLRRALEKLDSGEEIPAKGLNRPRDIETAWQKRVREQSSDFCPECKVPLLPDPKPEELYIYLHAIKYWSDEWSYEDTLPWWAREDWRSVPQRGSGTATPLDQDPSSAVKEAQTLPKDLPFANSTGMDISAAVAEQSSSPGTPGISHEIAAKAAKLAEAPKLDNQARGVELESVMNIVDLPLQASPSDDCDAEAALRIASASKPTHLEAPVVFEVFRGFEDVAQRDILQHVRRGLGQDLDAAAVPVTSSSLHSAHIRIDSAQHAAVAVKSFLGADLCVAKSAYVLCTRADFPHQLYLDLKRERIEAGESRRARRREAELKKAIEHGKGKSLGTRKKDGKAVEKPRIATDTGSDDNSQLEPARAVVENPGSGDTTQKPAAEEPQIFPSETVFLDLIDKVWDASLEEREKALRSWIRIKAASLGQEELAPEQLSYRATVDRSTYAMPGLTSLSLERHVGNLAWKWLNGDYEYVDEEKTPTKWKVNLEKPLLDVTLKLWPGFGVADEFEKELEGGASIKTQGSIAYMLRLPEPLKIHPHRPVERNEILVGGTNMARYRAFALGLALPVPTKQHSAGEAEGFAPDSLRILEPCCGHGSLIFETATALEDRGIKAEILGCDIDSKTVQRAEKIGDISKFDPARIKLKLQHVDTTKLEDVVNFAGGRNSVDAIITDLPWGRREKAAQSLSKLYSYFLESWLAVLRIGGSIIAVTAEQRTLSRAIAVFETACRKQRVGCILRCEELRLAAGSASTDSASDKTLGWVQRHEDGKALTQATLDSGRTESLRKIEIGYHVYVFLIRKIAL